MQKTIDMQKHKIDNKSTKITKWLCDILYIEFFYKNSPEMFKCISKLNELKCLTTCIFSNQTNLTNVN